VTTPERWARIEQLYYEALGLAANQRGSFLADACAGDDTLREEVESLLAHDGGAAFLSTPAVSDRMPAGIGIGQKLGPYVISARIGEGGMGEVYRAQDTKLGRDVAIKILPPAFTADPNRLARFEREARLLASLNHPHIGAIYGVEESDGVPALVLELVEGDTLADKLARGAARVEGLPVPEALAIARQIADALDAAHERGIVHRDLKPANIKITPAGTVKVLDFGLAKVCAADGSGPALSRSPAMGIGHTRDGMMLGTAAYMSPEQARGQVVDKRTDIWAFGCVFYELLTGRPAFARATFSDTITAVLAHEPDWTALPRTTPPYLARLLKRCLEKDSARRQRDIGDARAEIEGAEPPSAERERRHQTLGWRARMAVGVGGAPSLPGRLRSASSCAPQPRHERKRPRFDFPCFRLRAAGFFTTSARSSRYPPTDRNWHSSPSRLQTLPRCGFGPSQSSRRASCPAPRGRRRSSGLQTVNPSRSLRVAS
jgi:eukaryotic-like serine/threonine-protein kinase